MTFKDILLGIPFLLFIYGLAFVLKSSYTTSYTSKYYIPALTLKVIGAIALGLIFQFYYGYGGDTFHFYNNGMSVIAESFYEDPQAAIRLLFFKNEYHYSISKYIPRIPMFYDTSTYFVVRIGGLFAILTGNTYTNTALCFAVFSFSGLWSLYSLIIKSLPNLHKQLAIAFFFFPSVFFWGSGLLKDTITLGSLAWLTYGLLNVIVFKEKIFTKSFYLLFIYLIIKIKIYIILCFIPTAIIWIFTQHSQRIKNKLLRQIVTPLVLVISIAGGILISTKLGESSNRYSVDRVLITAEETARWLTTMGEHDQGSVYSLGDFDYSYTGIAKKAIPAIWVTLFRPYIFEANNVVMLLSALESLLFLLFTIYILYRHGILSTINTIRAQPFIAFCLIFSILFSFAIGISTYNFGTLVRYKIPMMPFYLMGLFCIDYFLCLKNNKKPFLQ